MLTSTNRQTGSNQVMLPKFQISFNYQKISLKDYCHINKCTSLTFQDFLFNPLNIIIILSLSEYKRYMKCHCNRIRVLKYV